MNRRKFIYAAGTIGIASSFLTASSFTEGKNKQQKRISPNQFTKPVMKGIAYGLFAPNPHNTQAWKFEILSDNSALFYVDEGRILGATDPPTRQVHIGCGCFLECARLGMMLDGYETQIERFPDKSRKYQKSTLGTVPLAKISFLKNPTLEVDPLSEYIFERSTSRLKYNDSEVMDKDFTVIQQLVKANKTKLALVNNPSELKKILPILSEGMKVEAFTYHTHEESRKWFRENDDLIAKKRDGINLPGNGVFGIKKWIAQMQLKGLKASKWHSKKMNEYSLKSHHERVVTSKGVVYLKTQANTFDNWLDAGVDYIRLQLACLKLGYHIHPLSQVLQEFKEMDDLRVQFEKEMRVTKHEKIQMVARIGKSDKPYKTFRRKPESLIL